LLRFVAVNQGFLKCSADRSSAQFYAGSILGDAVTNWLRIELNQLKTRCSSIGKFWQ
jgi:hypothetical protein